MYVNCIDRIVDRFQIGGFVMNHPKLSKLNSLLNLFIRISEWRSYFSIYPCTGGQVDWPTFGTFTTCNVTIDTMASLQGLGGIDLLASPQPYGILQAH